TAGRVQSLATGREPFGSRRRSRHRLAGSHLPSGTAARAFGSSRPASSTSVPCGLAPLEKDRWRGRASRKQIIPRRRSAGLKLVADLLDLRAAIRYKRRLDLDATRPVILLARVMGHQPLRLKSALHLRAVAQQRSRDL